MWFGAQCERLLASLAPAPTVWQQNAEPDNPRGRRPLAESRLLKVVLWLRLVAFYFCILSHNYHSHNLELIVEPKLPRPSIVLEFYFEQVLRSAFQAQFFPAQELCSDYRLRLLVWIQSPKLGALFWLALHHAFLLFAD